MAQLDCGACSCVYNKDKCCCKGDIMVGGRHVREKEGTCCESFSAKRAGDSYISALEHPSRTISIDCEADNCIYNTNYRCFAEHVDILGSNAKESGQTICGTFKQR